MRSLETHELHPLHHVVMRAFEDSDVHDASSLLIYLAGANSFGKETTKKAKAYTIVAEDVLKYMESHGHLCRGSDGWFRLTVTNDS